MKRTLMLSFLVLMLCVVSVLAEFHRTVSVTGGSGQRLTTVMAAAGYTGGDHLDELILCTPTGAANTMYIGNVSSVDATTGFPIPAGTCERWRAASRPIHAESYYLFVATTQNAGISVRQR